MCHNLKALTWMLLLLHIGYTVDVGVGFRIPIQQNYPSCTKNVEFFFFLHFWPNRLKWLLCFSSKSNRYSLNTKITLFCRKTDRTNTFSNFEMIINNVLRPSSSGRSSWHEFLSRIPLFLPSWKLEILWSNFLNKLHLIFRVWQVVTLRRAIASIIKKEDRSEHSLSC